MRGVAVFSFSTLRIRADGTFSRGQRYAGMLDLGLVEATCEYSSGELAVR